MAGLPDAPKAAQGLLDRLAKRGLVAEGAFSPIPTRAGDVVSVEVEPASACNLKCRHCFVDFSGERMTDELMAKVFDGAARLGVVEVTFNGGEPLLHPRCVDWIEESRRRGFRALLFTNGTRVTEPIARRLAAAGVARVTVSVDGFEPEHDSIRGAGSFRRTVEGIRRLTSTGLSVFTTTMVHGANEESVGELQRYCQEELRVAGCRTSTVAPMGRAKAAPDLLLARASFQRVYAGERPPGPLAASGRLPCNAGVDKLYVSALGDVYPCHLFELVGARLGDLRAHEMPALVAGREARDLTSLDPARLHECSSCSELATCGGGCRARAWSIRGDRFGRDPVACAKRGLLEINDRAALA